MVRVLSSDNDKASLPAYIRQFLPIVTLLRQIKSGNDDAMECLLERYRDMVRKEARRFFLAGGDEEV